MKRVIVMAAVAVPAAILVVTAAATGGFAANPAAAPIPADKAPFVAAQASFRAVNSAHQKTSAELASLPMTAQQDEPPLTGSVSVDAPAPAAEFTPSGNAYFVVQNGRWIRVWVGAPAGDPTSNKVLVISAPMKGDVIDPSLPAQSDLLAAPLSGGPLHIVGIDSLGRVLIANPAGKQLPFNAVSRAFGN
jgi:hypothetical protein